MATFVDQVHVHLQAGRGGNGCVSIRREKFKPLAGPDGGSGGHGANIELVADPQVTTLLEYHRRPHRTAQNGGYGAGDYRAGTHGTPLTLPVPVGTVIKDEHGTTLADLNEAGARYLAAKGGIGGLGNQALASSQRKAPGFALLGTDGETCTLQLELKTIADVALVGYPSAGKSSLIAAMSAAKPKIADYPFTTLHPNLGVVQAGEHRFTIADVPGLIEGASEGKGLGLDFLRHIERCSALLHVLDCATLESGRDPISDLEIIRDELASYPVADGHTPLLEREQLVALNKIDVAEARELADFVRPELIKRGYRVYEISAVSGEGLKELGYALAALVEQHRSTKNATPLPRQRIVLTPHTRGHAGFHVVTEGGTYGTIYRILGEKPERWVQQTDFANDEAVGYLADRLHKLGVEESLIKAGALAGSTVVIGPGAGIVFDWEPTVTSAAEVQMGARGTDVRVDHSPRRTNQERRIEYHQRMDAKTRARAELEEERRSGLWKEES